MSFILKEIIICMDINSVYLHISSIIIFLKHGQKKKKKLTKLQDFKNRTHFRVVF